ncbi:hypothetical protein SOVF_178390, partial [Spinacia oleracea]
MCLATPILAGMLFMIIS